MWRIALTIDALTQIDEEETTIKVASAKSHSAGKGRRTSNGVIKLKRPAPKYSKPGNWKEGNIIEGSY